MAGSKLFAPMVTAIAMAVSFAACSGDDNYAIINTPVAATPTTAIFEVTLVNLTAGQPLSPMVAAAHDPGFSMFSVGELVSVALEHIAEAGESAPMAALAAASKSVCAVGVASGAMLVTGPDNKAVVTLTMPVASLPALRLSMASMLGNTNDGFAGLSAQPLAALAVGASSVMRLVVYDAGAELNTESADTVPGTATESSGGKREGFNASRSDLINVIHVHPGILSRDDGLATSALTQAQRWDNPVAPLTVKRMQ